MMRPGFPLLRRRGANDSWSTDPRDGSLFAAARPASKPHRHADREWSTDPGHLNADLGVPAGPRRADWDTGVEGLLADLAGMRQRRVRFVHAQPRMAMGIATVGALAAGAVLVAATSFTSGAFSFKNSLAPEKTVIGYAAVALMPSPSVTNTPIVVGGNKSFTSTAAGCTTTATATATQTSTQGAGATSTGTPCATSSSTASATASASGTATPSASGTANPACATTVSGRPTVVRGQPRGIAPTPDPACATTATPSGTPTPNVTGTATGTATATGTSTATNTSTTTATATAIPDFNHPGNVGATPDPSASPTDTATATPTVPPPVWWPQQAAWPPPWLPAESVAKLSSLSVADLIANGAYGYYLVPGASVTATFFEGCDATVVTVTQTAGTPTPPPSVTPSPTPIASGTPGCTPAATPSGTFTVTLTWVPYVGWVPVLDPSVLATPTPTATEGTPTPPPATATDTASATATDTPTPTPTPTDTPSATTSPSPTDTPSATSTESSGGGGGTP